MNSESQFRSLWPNFSLDSDENPPRHDVLIKFLDLIIKIDFDVNPHVSCFYGEVSATWRFPHSMVRLAVFPNMRISLTFGDIGDPIGSYQSVINPSLFTIEETLYKMRNP